MKAIRTSKIKAFRMTYLTLSLALCAYMLYQLIAGICTGLNDRLGFTGIINLFSLLFALLFETGITLFIIRSLHASQTLLMKNLVFNRDGSPYHVGVGFVSIGAPVFLAMAVFFLGCTYGWELLSQLDPGMLLLAADVTLIFGLNLSATMTYFLLFRHEAGAFALI